MNLTRCLLAVLAVCCASPAAFAATITVNSSNDIGGVGTCVLRDAITAANSDAPVNACTAGSGTDTIQFAIVPVDTTVKTILLGSTLPTIAAPVVIDGYANAATGATANTLPSGSNAVLKVYLNGVNAGMSTYGLTIGPGGSGSTVRGLVIGNFGAGGILLNASSNNIIRGNFIGVNSTGNVTVANGNQGYGGGVVTLADAAGETANGNTIGGTAPADRNVISTNCCGGVRLQAYSGGASNDNQIIGNVIGPNKAGTGAVTGTVGSLSAGISISGAKNTTIGSTVGAVPAGPCSGGCNLIGSNYYGITASGDTDIGNLTIKANFFGVKANGIDQMPMPGSFNPAGAMNFSSLNNGLVQIGGITAAERNIISGGGNTPGIDIQNFNHNATFVVQGNYIGTDVTGTVAVPNQDGIHVLNSGGVTIGGTAGGAGNLISGNNYAGINMEGAQGVVVQGNKIGTQADGSSDLGNGRDGMRLGTNGFGLSDNNVIGANTSGGAGGNVIAFNGVLSSFSGSGITVQAGVHNRISSNQIFNNVGATTGLAIDLQGDGPTDNDTCDTDAGANDLSNAPSKVSYTTNAGVTTVSGLMRGKASTFYTIEFYANIEGDPSGYGEGRTYAGSTTVSTGTAPNCLALFSGNTIAALAPGTFLTAIAIDPQNNTSEFSGPFDLIFANGFEP